MKQYFYKSILTLTCFFYFIVPLKSQIKIHKSLSVEDGLVQSQVTCIYKDTEGYLWFGTLGGLSRWDGMNFTNFQIQDGLSSPLVSAIIQDSIGALYIGTNGGGVSILKDGKFDTLTTNDGLADNHVYAALYSKSGKMYFGTAAGISIYSNRKFETLDESNGLASNRVTSIYESKDGSIYFCTAAGITVSKNDSLSNITSAEGLTGDKVTCIKEADDGSQFISTWGDGVTIIRGRKFIPLNISNGLSNEVVFTEAKGKNNKMYFGTWGGGVNIYADGNIETITEKEGLGNNVVMSAFEDNNGVAYFGTDGGGVSIYSGGKFVTWDVNAGLAEMSVRAIYKSKRGDLFFGTDATGTTVITDSRILQLNEKNGLSDNRIRCFYEMEDGSILIGTFGGGIDVYKNGKILPAYLSPSLEDQRIKVIYKNKTGELLIGTYNEGILIYKDGKVKRKLNELNGLASNYINSIYQDDDSTYYFGTWEGLNIMNGDSLILFNTSNGLANNYVNAILKDSYGKILIGTDGGLNIYANGRLETINTTNGLSDNTILGILEDRSGRIYLSTNRGVNVLEFIEDTLSIRTLRYNDGLASDECNQGAVYKDDSEDLWFGTSKGVSRYDPSQDPPNLIPPRVHITRIRIFENDLKIPKSSFVDLSYDEDYIKFDFIGIDLPKTEKVVYRYRLSGVDKNWVETKQRFVQYTNLEDGLYQFEVKAKNEWGVWSNPDTFNFKIHPPFWATWWFRLIGLILAGTLLWYLYNLRVQRLLAIEKMRVRIASDLHDDIGATLTNISANSEVIRHINDTEKIKKAAIKIGTLSREVIQTMSDIVWSIDSRNDSVHDMISRMQDFSHQVLSTKNIEMSFLTDGINLSKKMSVETRENLYLIFKEAINNIAKHSGANKVVVKLKNSSDHFIMTIADDGNGIKDIDSKKGNGLKNIKMRAERISGNVEYENTNGFNIKIVTPSI